MCGPHPHTKRRSPAYLPSGPPVIYSPGRPGPPAAALPGFAETLGRGWPQAAHTSACGAVVAHAKHQPALLLKSGGGGGPAFSSSPPCLAPSRFLTHRPRAPP
eukprot:366147-Chlamydomonas_euryale.AAC.13